MFLLNPGICLQVHTASSPKINIDEDHFGLLPKTFILKSVDYVMRAVTVTVIIVFLN
jgi:hypothetical protein